MSQLSLIEKEDAVENICRLARIELEGLSLSDKVDALNRIRETLHELSPFKSEPVDFVRWVENTGKAPSWRRVCKTLLRNDYWCKYLGFSPTKTSAYQRYTDLMARRRKNWNIFNDMEQSA